MHTHNCKHRIIDIAIRYHIEWCHSLYFVNVNIWILINVSEMVNSRPWCWIYEFCTMHCTYWDKTRNEGVRSKSSHYELYQRKTLKPLQCTLEVSQSMENMKCNQGPLMVKLSMQISMCTQFNIRETVICKKNKKQIQYRRKYNSRNKFTSPYVKDN